MDMDINIIFRALKQIGKIGNEGYKSSEQISDASRIITDVIYASDVTRTHPKAVPFFEEFLSEFGDGIPWRQDKRLFCTVSSLYLLNSLLNILDELKGTSAKTSETETGENTKGRKAPEPPSNLISVQHQQTVEGCVKYILYSSYFGSLDEDGVLYLKMKVMQGDSALATNIIKVPPQHCHGVLKLTLKHLLPLIKHKCFGTHLQRSFLPEILCGFLQLSFSPEDTSRYPVDVPFFRHELEALFGTISAPQVLKAILLLKGITAQKEGKCWLKAVCQSLYARRFLLRENGVRLVLEAALSVGDFSDWRKKEIVAALISSARIRDETLFFEKLCPQILALLKDLEKSGEIFQILAFSVCQLAKRSPRLAQTHLFEPLLAPVSNLTTTTAHPDAIHSEDLVHAVSTLYKLYVQVLPPSAELRPFLKLALCPLASVAALPPTCHVKTDSQLVLVRYLSQLEIDEAVSTLLVIVGLEVSEAIPAVNPDLKLVPRLNRIEVETRSDQRDWIEEDERRVKSLIEIVDKLKSNRVVVEMLRRLTVYLDFTVLNDIEVQPNELLTEADISEVKAGKFRRLTLVVGLLTAITEQESFSAPLFNDLSSALPIVEALLKTHRQHCSDVDLAYTRETFLISCVMMLSCYVTQRSVSGMMTSSDWRCLKSVVPTLKQLKSDTQNAALTGLVKQLFQMVLTHGVIGANPRDNVENTHTRYAEPPLNIDAIDQSPTTASCSRLPPSSSVSSPPSATPAITKSQSADAQPRLLTPYQESLLNVCSVHLPVRGHALISLTKLLRTENEEAMRNRDRILSLFEHHLRDEDSYVYLAAIEGLVALSSQCPHKVVTILTEEFARSNQTVEMRLKLVEILTKTTRRLGSALPKYKNLFLNCLLNGVRDQDFLIRTSCLSNLGEVCKELRFSVEPIIHEVFSLVDSIIQNDESPEVRRAAVLLITLLLQGLGKDSLRVLQAVILDIYRSLKRLVLMQSDSVLVTHAELALEEINNITKGFLLPKISLSKKIFVTEVQSDFL